MTKRRVSHAVTVEKQGLTFLESAEEIHNYLTKAATAFADTIVRIGEGGAFDDEHLATGTPGSETPTPSHQGPVLVQFKGHFQQIEDRTNRFSVELKQSSEAKLTYEKAENKACLVLIFLKQGLILGVKSKIERQENGILFFGEPIRIFKLQRRKDVRWMIGWGYEIHVAIPVPKAAHGPFLTQRFRMLNLSRSGLLFLVETKGQADVIVGGMMLRGLTFSIQGATYKFDGVVRSKRVFSHPKYTEASGYSVGIEFVRPNKESAEAIEEIVMSHSAHLLM